MTRFTNKILTQYVCGTHDAETVDIMVPFKFDTIFVYAYLNEASVPASYALHAATPNTQACAKL